MAIDIIGFFFAGNREKRFFTIYDFYSRQGITDFHNHAPEMLHDLLVILLKGFVKKQLFRFKTNTNPHVEKLKRRCKDIFNNTELFDSQTIEGNEYIYLKTEKDNLRQDKHPIPYDVLESITLDAFHDSKTVQQWVVQVFKQVSSWYEYRNMVSKYLLLTAMVRINSEFIECGDYVSMTKYRATDTLIRHDIKSAAQTALSRLRTDTLSMYIRKQAVTRDEKELLYQACCRYLADYCAHAGRTDPIPVYFREMMPVETHERYLKDYKNIFESLIKRMLAFFTDEIKKNSTFQYIRNY